jgi:hypothetical protein
LKLFHKGGKEEIKENDGGGGFKYNIFDIRIFINAAIYSHSSHNK